MVDRTSNPTLPLNWMLYFLAGGLAGAAVALLLTPHSGEAARVGLRRRLRDTAGTARDLKDYWNRRSQKARNEAGNREDAAVSALAGAAGTNLPR